ncbi:MAG TPA: prenyltransferase/squalene oxidase repeat-containing protein [Gemmataceae bacterium]|jgi:prenyltransferase beta subunit|nr:prenyltransferase/squalene oxidase repeat-containing protein [Gemmataceae bacterium]
MKQAMVVACLFWANIAPAHAQAPTPLEKQATLAWLTKLQHAGGGFAGDAKAGAPVTLPATLSAVRALKYFGSVPGSVPPHAVDVVRFVRSCWNESEGAFAPTPGGTPDVRTTAVGLMGLFDLEAADQNQDMIARGMTYLGKNVKDYEEVRIAAAAFEVTKKPFPQLKKWQEILHGLQSNKEADQPREIGGVTVALLRLGEPLENKEAILKSLRAGQRPEGAWGKAGAAPELETSYRVMRAFYMLKANPDVAALRKFIARCRQPDGSYAVAPGQPGSVSATYYAGIISSWLDQLQEPGGPL